MERRASSRGLAEVAGRTPFSTLRNEMTPEAQERARVMSEALEAALVEGEESGEPQPFDFEAFKARKRAEYEG